MKPFCRSALYLAWVVALVGFLVSFYFGEISEHEPCRLCWYQRVALFPLALWLGIAAYRDDKTMATYAIPLALFGLVVALYQSISQKFPILEKEHLCGYKDDCGAAIFSLFGVITLPILSLIGFVVITILLFMARKDS